MATEYEILACHADHAGKAHLSIKHLTSEVEVAIQHVPFDNNPDESLSEEQSRILADAARVAREVAAFLESECERVRSWPTQAQKPGPAPNEDESSNVFGQPTPHSESPR